MARALKLAPPPRRVLVAAAALAGAAGVAAGVAVHFAVGPASASPALALPALHGQAVWPARREEAPGFALRDESGRFVSLTGQRGRTVVLAFMDPRCNQECRSESFALGFAQRRVTSAQRATVLIVSVDPAATAAEARAAARTWRIPDTHWLLGTRDELARVWRAYRITVRRSAVYLIDRQGFERVGLLAPLLPQFVADDLRELAREPA